MDTQGNALLCDWMNHKVHTYNVSTDQWSALQFTDRLDYPVDVCQGQDKITDLYVVQHGVAKVQPNKFLHFTAVLQK